MKIDEACINHNALLLIGEMVSGLYDYTDTEPSLDHTRVATLGEIRGICRMADVMKEVLKL